MYKKKKKKILREKLTVLSVEFENLLIKSLLRKQPSEFYQIGYEMKWKNQVLKSLASHINKSIDYFVELRNGIVGTIEFFVNYEKTEYLVIRRYEILNESSQNHLNYVHWTDEMKVLNCTLAVKPVVRNGEKSVQ